MMASQTAGWWTRRTSSCCCDARRQAAPVQPEHGRVPIPVPTPIAKTVPITTTIASPGTRNGELRHRLPSRHGHHPPVIQRQPVAQCLMFTLETDVTPVASKAAAQHASSAMMATGPPGLMDSIEEAGEESSEEDEERAERGRVQRRCVRVRSISASLIPLSPTSFQKKTYVSLSATESVS